MIREIDCFDRLISNTEIVELDKQLLEKTSHPELGLLYKSNSYKPLLLISSVGQKEIEHFLDDEQSKTSAVQSSAISAMVNGDLEQQTELLITLLQQSRNKLQIENADLKGRMGQINNTKTATSLVRQANLVKYIKKNGLPVPNYAETFEPEIDESKVEELANKKAVEFMTVAREAALKARASLEEHKVALKNAQVQADEFAKQLLFYQKQERENNEAATKNWPKPEWRPRADILREWGIDTGAPGQQGWKDFTKFCCGLSPYLSRYNPNNSKSELRVDIANKFRAQIVDFFVLDLGIPLYEGNYSGEF
jgi:hypothetical protein